MTIRLIDPYFLAPPSIILPISAGNTYRVQSVTNFQEYTLTAWELGDEINFATGETLYRLTECLACCGGRLSLGEPIQFDKSAMLERPWESVSNIVDRNIGNYGVPQAVAIGLRKNDAIFFVTR